MSLCFQTPKAQVTILDAAWLLWTQVLKAHCCEGEGHCRDAEPHRSEWASSRTKGTEARQGRSWPLWGQTASSGFPALLFFLSSAFRETWDASGVCPLHPAPTQEGCTGDSGLGSPGSATWPLPSLRFSNSQMFKVSFRTSDPSQTKRRGSGCLRGRRK